MDHQTRLAVARFYAERAGYPLDTLRPGEVVVSHAPCSAPSPSSRRSRVLSLWVEADRAVFIAAPGYRHLLDGLLRSVSSPTELLNPGTVPSVAERLAAQNRGLVSYLGRKYCCDRHTVRPVFDAAVHKLTPEAAPQAIRQLKSVGIPEDAAYLLAEDAAFAYYCTDAAVAFAGTHPAKRTDSATADVMLGTLPQYRRRGFGKAVISATTDAVISRNRVAVWGMSYDNVAAMRTAAAIGYQEYCTLLDLRSPA